MTNKLKMFSFALFLTGLAGFQLSPAFASETETVSIAVLYGTRVEAISYDLQDRKTNIGFSNTKTIEYVKSVKETPVPNGGMGGGLYSSAKIMGHATYGVTVTLSPVAKYKHVYTFSVQDKSFDSLATRADGSQKPKFSNVKIKGTVTLLRGKNTIPLGEHHSLVVVLNPAT